MLMLCSLVQEEQLKNGELSKVEVVRNGFKEEGELYSGC